MVLANGAWEMPAGVSPDIGVTVLSPTGDGSTLTGVVGADSIDFLPTTDNTTNAYPHRHHYAVTRFGEIRHFGEEANYVSGQVYQQNQHGYKNVKRPVGKEDTGIREIIGVAQSTFVIFEDGDLYSWGYNGYGQLGIGNTTNSASMRSVLGNVVKFASAAGGYHTNRISCYAINTSGELYSWGTNVYGQLGHGNTTQLNSPVKVVISGLTANESVVDVVASCSYVTSAAILTSSGRVFTVGYNANGQLGLGHTLNKHTFKRVSSLASKNVTKIRSIGGTRHSTAGYYRHSYYVVCDDGDTYAWGFNGSGQLGIGNTTQQTSPVQTLVTGVSDITTSKDEWGGVFFQKTNGEIWRCGHNKYGNLGTGNTTDVSTPVQLTLYLSDGVANTSGVDRIQALASVTHSYHRGWLILMNDGRLYSCGYNGNGQLGVNSTANVMLFQEVIVPLHGSRIKQLSMGGYSSSIHVLILLEDGRVYGMGHNAYGQCNVAHTSGYVTVPTATFQ